MHWAPVWHMGWNTEIIFSAYSSPIARMKWLDFLLKAGISHMEVGIHRADGSVDEKKSANYAASVYLGDLLVTCYSLFSRNRTFGNMIGKGYSVHAAKLELNMVAEGYNASHCLYLINEQLKAEMPIADTIYRILWQNVNVSEGFKQLEGLMV